MRVLCCFDGTNSEQMSQAVSTLLLPASAPIGLLYVIDSAPEVQMEFQRERFLRSPRPPHPRQAQMRQAEEATAQEILEEGKRLLGKAELLTRSGRPEREIVQAATDWQADLLLVCSRSLLHGPVPPGPRSVGHVARFVLDHAPCPVLLLRPRLGSLR